MPRLVINPGTPSTWEIQLRPGTNLLGRGFANDFKIDHPSVSGSHCQIVVENGNVLIKDLGSTNGTFVNRAPVNESVLQPGQIVHLGGVEMVYQSDAPQTATVTETEMLQAPPMPPPITMTAHGAAAPAGTVTGSGPCKFHPRTAGRYLCKKCRQYFCELCVATRTVHGLQKKFCRACGAELAPVQVQIQRVSEKGFFARLPGVFIYPFKGAGVIILLIASVIFALLDQSSWFMFMATMAVLGYVFTFMQSIIHSTAAGDEEMADLPPFDGLFGAFFMLAGTVAVSFGIPIGLAVAKILFDAEGIPTSALIATSVLGCLYFPMAFLAVAMKDSVMAANPLVVIPAMFKVPLEYFVTSVFVICVYGVRLLGDSLSSAAAGVGLHTRDMSTLFMTFGLRIFWTLLSVYLLTVSMRILGILYLTKKRQLGWFEH
jgi:hypothetical protein